MSDLFLCSFLLSVGTGGRVQQKVSGNIVEFAKGYKVVDGHFVGATLIAGIHRLGSAQNIGNLLLGQIVVLPQASELFHKCPHFLTA